MGVALAILQRAGEGCHVHPEVSLGVDLQRIGLSQQKGWWFVTTRRGGGSPWLFVAEQKAQTVQRLAQVLAGAVIRKFGPQEGGQGLAAVDLAMLNGQIGQQSARFIGLEGADDLLIEGCAKRAE